MDRVYETGAVANPPAAVASQGLYPTQGSKTTGTRPTKPGAYWFHSVTEEIRNAVVAAGMSPSSTELDQLAKAIVILAQRILTATGSKTKPVFVDTDGKLKAIESYEGTANRAIMDSNGKNIDSTYLKKTDAAATYSVNTHTHNYAGSSSAGGTANRAVADKNGKDITTYLASVPVANASSVGGIKAVKGIVAIASNVGSFSFTASVPTFVYVVHNGGANDYAPYAYINGTCVSSSTGHHHNSHHNVGQFFLGVGDVLTVNGGSALYAYKKELA